VFVIAPSLVSGSIWLFGSVKARKTKNLGLWHQGGNLSPDELP
jgi:hypothetical protein